MARVGQKRVFCPSRTIWSTETQKGQEMGNHPIPHISNEADFAVLFGQKPQERTVRTLSHKKAARVMVANLAQLERTFGKRHDDRKVDESPKTNIPPIPALSPPTAQGIVNWDKQDAIRVNFSNAAKKSKADKKNPDGRKVRKDR